MTTTRERALEAALRDMLSAYGGDCPEWLRQEYDAGWGALALPTQPEAPPVATGDKPQWSVSWDEGCARIEGNDGHGTIARLRLRKTKTNNVAEISEHARLIAAAPDMLAVLQYVDSCAPAQPGDGSAPLDDTEHVEIVVTGRGLLDLRAAIARATGREG